MQTGQMDKFQWLESPTFDISEVIKHCPEVLVGKFVVISCCDSGPLQLSPEEIGKGWSQHGELAITSRLTDLFDLPFDNNDEWYVLPEFRVPQIADTFVNYDLFRLSDADQYVQNVISSVGDQADVLGAKIIADRIAEQQVVFWHQMRECDAESYIADGHVSFRFVSQNADYFEKVKTAILNVKFIPVRYR
jgi:hypothetical protein